MTNDKWLNTNSKIKLLSHTDLDGHGSEIVLKGLGFKPEVWNLGNYEVDSYIDKYVTDILEGIKKTPDILVITDIAPTKEVAEKVNELYKRNLCDVYLFDHHKTALDLNKYDWARVLIEEDGTKQCGTSLLYKHLVDAVGFSSNHLSTTMIDQLVEEIRLYDTWDWEPLGHTSAKKMNDLLYLIGPKKFIQCRLDRIAGLGLDLFSSDEEMLLEVENSRIASYVKRKSKSMVVLDDFFTNAQGEQLVAGVVQADSHTSELGHYLCDDHPEIDFVAMLKLTENNVSFRAVKEEVDLTPIVQRYKGGGHPHAAGCSLKEIGSEFLMEIFKKL